MENILNLEALLKQAMEADVTALRQFLTTNPGQPLVATGSGGAEPVADFAALLYGARGGIATAVSPYTLNSYSDEALKTSKLLLVSKGGHNNDIVFAAKRGLAVNPDGTASWPASPCTWATGTKSGSCSSKPGRPRPSTSPVCRFTTPSSRPRPR